MYDTLGAAAALLCLLVWPYLWWKGYGEGLAERLGRVPELPRGERPVWVHAASVGETLSAVPLVERLRERRAGVPILTTSTTLNGRALALRELKPDAAMLLPIDPLGIVERAMERIRPRCLVIIETEIWPGLLRAAHRRAIPVVAVSACMSEQSARRYARWGALLRPSLRPIAAVGAQSAADAERIIACGARREAVRVTGSLKATRRVAGGGVPLHGLESRPVLVAASTQPGEEDFVLDACAALWAEWPDLLLVLAPRRPERFGEVGEILVARRGMRTARRSTVAGSVAPEVQVLLLDTVGELVRFFSAARGVFVGGTIAPLGGHNLLEPATYGRPVAFGPHVGNVADVASALCAAGGGVTVRRAAELEAHWRTILSDPHTGEEMGRRARAVAEAGADALERTWDLMRPYVEGDA